MLSAAVVCLALNMYHEGRGEGPVGQIAIGQVVLNRSAKSPLGRKDVCSIVHEGGPIPKWKCQFTWYCDGRSDTPQNRRAWFISLTLSRALLDGRVGLPSLMGANCYYAITRKRPPAWATDGNFKSQIGKHRFYVCR